MKLFPEQFSNAIPDLGPCKFANPIRTSGFISDSSYELYETDRETVKTYIEQKKEVPSFIKAGPREKLFYNPSEVSAGIVTCGGLCPGLNDVIRSLVMVLYYQYGVKRILGYRYGYNGIIENPLAEPVVLTPSMVRDIHNEGGTMLGSSRGQPDVGLQVDRLEKDKVQMLFTIGGDGTLRGTRDIALMCMKRGNNISVIGIPKTIDNDIGCTSRSFGFLTSVEEARTCISAMHNESLGAPNGVGLIKLMGRDSGYIAANACLANNHANFCLIPEVAFNLNGPGGLLAQLQKRLEKSGHAVIVVAEGAGQNLFGQDGAVTDASGNKLHKDIGILLKDKITQHFKENKIPLNLKYVDPSYLIRSKAANAEDSSFCLILGQHAVHAAMAGKTNTVIAYWNNTFILVPVSMAVARRKKIDPAGELWQSVLTATGQPPVLE